MKKKKLINFSYIPEKSIDMLENNPKINIVFEMTICIPYKFKSYDIMLNTI